jgi:hypothetical protein
MNLALECNLIKISTQSSNTSSGNSRNFLDKLLEKNFKTIIFLMLKKVIPS